MESIEILAALLAFAALMISWAVAPTRVPGEAEEPAAAPAVRVATD